MINCTWPAEKLRMRFCGRGSLGPDIPCAAMCQLIAIWLITLNYIEHPGGINHWVGQDRNELNAPWATYNRHHNHRWKPILLYCNLLCCCVVALCVPGLLRNKHTLFTLNKKGNNRQETDRALNTGTYRVPGCCLTQLRLALFLLHGILLLASFPFTSNGYEMDVWKRARAHLAHFGSPIRYRVDGWFGWLEGSVCVGLCLSIAVNLEGFILIMYGDDKCGRLFRLEWRCTEEQKVREMRHKGEANMEDDLWVDVAIQKKTNSEKGE